MKLSRIKPVVPVVVLALLLLAPAGLSEFRLLMLIEILALGLAASSLAVLFQSGLFSFGHALPVGIGAYAAALAAQHITEHALVGIALALVTALAVAAVTGLLAVRSRGVYFLMLTLAFAQLAYTGALTWTSFTGGTNGLTLSIVNLGGGPLGQWAMYYFVLAVAALGYVALRLLVASPFGRALQGIRENERAMQALGYPTTRYKLTIYALAGAVAGVAGGLMAQTQRFVDPSSLAFHISAVLLIAVVIGGASTLWGPVIGVAIIEFFETDVSSSMGEHWRLGLGLLYVVAVYLMRDGISAVASSLAKKIERRESPAPVPRSELVER